MRWAEGKGQRWLAVVACALVISCRPADPSVFDPDSEVRSRILPLRIHIIDPNLRSVEDPAPLLKESRILEARYIITKDFTRNVFLPDLAESGRLIVRVDRTPATDNASWIFGCVATLGVAFLVGVPCYSNTAHVGVRLAILDANETHVAEYSAIGQDTEYAAMYWGRSASFRGMERQHAIAAHQMMHALALADALDQLRAAIGRDAQTINRNLRDANGTQ